MKKECYSITDIALMTMLSTRTIRTYIKNGILTGNKIDGVWSFTEEELNRFLKQDYVKQGIQIKTDAIVRDFMESKKKSRNSVCSICDYPIEDELQAERLCDKIINLINTNPYNEISFAYHYDVKDNMVRFIITGQAEQVTNLIININNI